MHLYGLLWFSKIYISQVTVATQLRCGGIFDNQCIPNFSQSGQLKTTMRNYSLLIMLKLFSLLFGTSNLYLFASAWRGAYQPEELVEVRC